MGFLQFTYMSREIAEKGQIYLEKFNGVTVGVGKCVG
jgi:hypothetical protein